MALRASNQAVASDAPSLKSANADLVPRSSRPGVRAGKSPVIFWFAGLQPKILEDHAKIREGSHKGLRQLGDCVPSDGRRVIVHAQRAVLRVECRHTRGLLAAPCCGIARGEIAQLEQLSRHGTDHINSEAE